MPPNNHSVVGFVAGGVYLTVTAPDGRGRSVARATDVFNDTITITVSGPTAH